MKIEYHPFVVDDLSDAETHYGQLQPGLSQAFRAEVTQTIKQIKELKITKQHFWRPGMGTLALNADERVASVDFSSDFLIVGLMDGRQISVPLKWYPRLAGAICNLCWSAGC